MISGYPDLPIPLTEKEQRDWVLRLPDPVAKNALILGNLRLVAKIARRYGEDANDRYDLFSEGVLALVRALHDYDPDAGAKFSTYAYTRVHGHMLHVMRSDELKRRQIGKPPLSLDFSTGMNEDALGSIIPDPQDPISDGLFALDMEQAIQKMPARSRKFIRERILQDWKWSEISAHHRISQTRLHQILREDREILRKALRG